MRWPQPPSGRAGRALAGVSALVFVGVALRARRAPSLRQTVLGAPSAEGLSAIDAARGRLEQFEAQRRSATDFAHLAPANVSHGADPYALARLDPEHLVGVLRGASALVLLSNDLRELQRIPVPGSAVSVEVTAPGECWVAAEASRALHHFRFDGHALRPLSAPEIAGIFGVRALASGVHGLLYALDVHDGRLLTLRPSPAAITVLDSRVIGHGPLSLQRIGDSLVVDCFLDHALVVYQLGPGGQILGERARIRHDGPTWAFSATQLPDGQLAIATLGVEDHALDRSGGAFGYIDSFLYWHLLPKNGAVRELWRVNTSALGVVTPKVALLRVTGNQAQLFVTGYASDRAALFEFDARAAAPPKARTEPSVPGISAGLALDSGAYAFADPLLDAWALRPASALPTAALALRPVVAPEAPQASPEERLGEALFFTTLMAPANSSEGAHSRFSCETCHFEGYVDGRVHYTGRANVYAATKPLRGLFNNRPHFSRALDPDLATVSHHEFRVAGMGNGSEPWFDLDVSAWPWLGPLGVSGRTIGAEALRRALMQFLMGFSHTPNPAVSGRTEFNDSESRGAELFRAHCSSCHAARLQSDVPESAVPFEAWPRAIFSAEGAVVWASAEYQKTGVTPYVHELGTRTPSLRRLYVKWPRFTNGSADSVRDVLSQVRYDEKRFFHAGAPSDPALSALRPTEITDLAAFLDLL
ncbi:MAG: c-type cytochrome [Pseudomonadota bacterium]